ncbi:MAG: hypothetical protein DWI00_06935 [Planctomycetota bacterium]|nr:MAG: hypothetical protein DWI00_06935 [Planctomycetota bacterium]
MKHLEYVEIKANRTSRLARLTRGNYHRSDDLQQLSERLSGAAKRGPLFSWTDSPKGIRKQITSIELQ